MNYAFVHGLGRDGFAYLENDRGVKVPVRILEITSDSRFDGGTQYKCEEVYLCPRENPNIKKTPPLAINVTIEKVIFNDPATIVFWSDGTKTVVKTQNGEKFDPEKGLAMAIAKKAFGNKGNYYNHIKKWTDKYREERTVKTDELCTRCKWSFTGDECKSHRHCTDCGHRDKYGRCLCLTVRSFDSCPYFKEATAE